MSLGKDSIQKRVAKPAATKAPAKKTPAKKATSKTATKTAVIANISPETVEKVIAHKENDVTVKFALGESLPYYLL
jgi:hypothetical protein